MLQRKPNGPTKLRSFGILVGVEIEDGTTTPEKVCMLISDALTWVAGVGAVNCENLGEIDTYEEPE